MFFFILSAYIFCLFFFRKINNFLIITAEPYKNNFMASLICFTICVGISDKSTGETDEQPNSCVYVCILEILNVQASLCFSIN